MYSSNFEKEKRNNMKKKLTTTLVMVTALAASLITACSNKTSSDIGSKPISTPPSVEPVLPPEKEPGVNSLAIKYNNAKITGELQVNLSLGTLDLVIDVSKDEGYKGSVTLDSSDKTVATIDNEGKITLLKAGETVISAKIGELKESFVLIVNAPVVLEAHSITVVGGTASVSQAKAGDLVTLTPDIPEHKEFIDWTFDGTDEIWRNGNTFKMPDRDIVITGQYEDMKYTLNLVGAKVADKTVQGTLSEDKEAEHQNVISYEFTYNAPVSIEAVEAPKGMIFVGFDYGIKNNRVGELGDYTYDFTMPDDTLTVWAVFSEFNTNMLPDNANPFGDAGRGAKRIKAGTPASESNDPDLEGLDGYRMAIHADQSRVMDSPENICAGCQLDSVKNGTTLVKTIFKNHHKTLPVTVEFYATYYGNIASSGDVTIQPGQTVTKYFIAGLGINRPWMGLAVKEDLSGSSSDTVLLDIVAGTAAYYPEGDKSLAVSGRPEYVTVDNYNAKNGWKASRPSIINNSVGMTAFGTRNMDYKSRNAYTTAKINNVPAYDPENKKMTVYAKVVNNVNQYDPYKADFKLAISHTDNPLTESTAVIKDFTFTKLGQSEVMAFTFERASNDENFYVSVIKPAAEPQAGMYSYNFVLQMCYNNVMGYEE